MDLQVHRPGPCRTLHARCGTHARLSGYPEIKMLRICKIPLGLRDPKTSTRDQQIYQAYRVVDIDHTTKEYREYPLSFAQVMYIKQ
jgi:hypothetical protein